MGYSGRMDSAIRDRLERIRGQVEGIIKMHHEGRDCSEIVVQLAAARSALGSVGKILLRDEAVKCSQTKKHDKLDKLLKQLFEIT